MSRHTIRKAEIDDEKALAECIDLAYSAFTNKIPDLPDVSDGLAAAIINKPVWVAVIEGHIVGGIVLDPREDYLILENVAVHPDASGAGIGKALIGKAESVCLNLGLHHIRLSTHKDMVDNISLYEHLGWRIVSADANKVHMTKPIQ